MGGAMREISVREANQNFSQVIAAAEGGETIVVTKNGRPVARISPQPEDRAGDPEWRARFAALEESLRMKRGSGRRAGIIDEDDKYGDDPA
jgi:prevent-host-death family protein